MEGLQVTSSYPTKDDMAGFKNLGNCTGNI
jgi:hypothetical protein